MAKSKSVEAAKGGKRKLRSAMKEGLGGNKKNSTDESLTQSVLNENMGIEMKAFYTLKFRVAPAEQGVQELVRTVERVMKVLFDTVESFYLPIYTSSDDEGAVKVIDDLPGSLKDLKNTSTIFDPFGKAVIYGQKSN